MKAKPKAGKHRVHPKKMTLSLPEKKKEKVRLAIECTPEERKYIKMFASYEEKTINEFVLDCIHLRMKSCQYSHVPNEVTENALDASERGEGHRSYKSIEDMFKFLGM